MTSSTAPRHANLSEQARHSRDELPDGALITLRHGDGIVEALRAVALTEEVAPGEEGSSLTLDSPLGQALAGHRVGDTVSYQIPNGPRRVEIVQIQAPPSR